jgi:signal transduction histidine kinase
MFTHQMMVEEQTEKRFLRLVQEIASEALVEGADVLKVRLKDVLRLVMEAMSAQSTALLLYNQMSNRLEVAASVGMADEELERHVSSLDVSSFAGRVAGHEKTTSLWDAEVTELTLSDALRGSGLHSLLGVRLPPRRALVGVMYVGVTEKRQFSAREIHRLESLGQHLTVHLDNARLYADLRNRIDELNSERELRERFVSVLAHDLRGPLSAARMSSELLMHHPEQLDERRDLASKIERSIDRTDRMIRDLLDANRIRAGQLLPLRLDECDLGAVAAEVYEELVAAFGERFALKAAPRVVGVWSADELRRALWNLATNAIKYGDANKPVTITVRRTAQGAQASVQNWGTPILREDQRDLFRPFSRTPTAQAGVQKGWGLGLTLVQGCAVAHGGRVVVDSSQESGTTFTLELPLDARLFQPKPDESRLEPASHETLH